MPRWLRDRTSSGPHQSVSDVLRMVAGLFADLAVHAAFELPSLPVCDLLLNFMHAQLQRTSKKLQDTYCNCHPQKRWLPLPCLQEK